MMTSEHENYTVNKALDVQVKNSHYKKYKIQPLEFAEANNLNACQFNILKYSMRHADKDGFIDLKKCMHMVEILMQIDYKDEYEEWLESGKLYN